MILAYSYTMWRDVLLTDDVFSIMRMFSAACLLDLSFLRGICENRMCELVQRDPAIAVEAADFADRYDTFQYTNG